MTFGETASVGIITAILTSLIVAPSSAYLTAWLSLRRYRLEKLWDKKAAAYEIVLGGMHDIIKYYDKTLEAHILEHSLSELYMEKLRLNLEDGRANVQKIARIGSFILSSEAEEILNDFDLQLERASDTRDWYDYIEACLDVSLNGFKAVRAEARRDLGTGSDLPGVAWLENRLERIRLRPGHSDLGAPKRH